MFRGKLLVSLLAVLISLPLSGVWLAAYTLVVNEDKPSMSEAEVIAILRAHFMTEEGVALQRLSGYRVTNAIDIPVRDVLLDEYEVWDKRISARPSVQYVEDGTWKIGLSGAGINEAWWVFERTSIEPTRATFDETLITESKPPTLRERLTGTPPPQ